MLRTTRFTFDWQIVPFMLSALLGLAVAYNQPVATIRFGLIVIGIVVYLLCANGRDSGTRSIVRALLIGLPAMLTMYFLLTNEWAKSSNKLPLLNTLPALIGGALQFNPNVVGGALAMLVPLQIEALKPYRRAIKVGLIVFTLIGLALSLTRGAWLALALVGGMWLAWRLLNWLIADRRAARAIWLAGMLVLAAIGGLLAFATPLGDRLLGLGGDRINIWRNSIALVGDYPLSGFGLGSFEMAYSSYVLLTHVGHTLHAHNLWLNVWLDQGLLGVVALIGLVLNSVWPQSTSSGWRTAALASIGVILIHTLFDDPFYGYGGVAIPLLFAPLALAMRGASTGVSANYRGLRQYQPAYGLWAVTVAMCVVGAMTPTGQAIIEENVGAISQTQMELAAYAWPAIPIQDALRRTDGVDLSTAIAYYKTAARIDSSNAAADRRWGQIELARGQYDSACSRLQAAFNARPEQRATRQLLGECYALRGDFSQAVELWRTIDLSESQLDIRQWWYNDYLKDRWRAARLQQAARMLTRN